MALVLLGKCRVKGPAGTYKCHCVNGRYFTGAPSSMCTECLHPLTLHDAYVPVAPLLPDRPSSIHDQPRLTHESTPINRLSPISPREKTVIRLQKLLDEYRVAYVRGTPSSGKTTLAKLLEARYREQGQAVIYVNTWHGVTDGTDHFVQRCRQEGYMVDRGSLASSDVVIVFDEAQHSYTDLDLWAGLIKTQSGANQGLRMCLFTSYGSPTAGRVDHPRGTTPVHFGREQRVSLTALDPEHPHLFYTVEEFRDAVERLCRDPTGPMALDDAATDYLSTVSNRHPAAVQALIRYVHRVYRSALNHREISTITVDHVIQALGDDADVFGKLDAYPVYRSFPWHAKIPTEAADALRMTLLLGNIPRDLQNPGIRLCYEQGWLHSDPPDPSEPEDLVCVLPSRLHEKFVECYFATNSPRSFPIAEFPSLPVFCLEILKKFSRSRLTASAQGRLGAGSQQRPVESQYQREFFCGFDCLLGPGHGISSEWSGGHSGRIDFRIIEPKWGIELLRDGDRLTEHCQRFENGGRYWNGVSNGWILDWIILDCRHTMPKPFMAVPGAKLWRVVFPTDFKSVTVLDAGNNVVMENFVLLD